MLRWAFPLTADRKLDPVGENQFTDMCVCSAIKNGKIAGGNRFLTHGVDFQIGSRF